MIREKFYEALADETCCSQDTGAPFLCCIDWASIARASIAWEGRFCVPGHAALIAIFGR